MSEFHLLRPLWLLALLPLALLLWQLVRRHGSGNDWTKVVDAHLLPHLLVRQGASSRPAPWIALGLGWLLAVLALAGPAFERLPQPVFRLQDPLVLALDLSSSMTATDVSPSRLVRARFKLQDIVKQRQEGQTALVVFAGDAFTVSP